MFSPQISTADETFGIEYIDSLFRYALVLTHSQVEAEDLVQETYVRAMQAFCRLREESNVRGWLFAILRNLWFTELRKRRSCPQWVEADADSVGMDGFALDAVDAHARLEKQEDAKRVRAAMRRLPPEFREVLVLREFEGLSYQEMAGVLGCPIGTVMSRLGRARSKLRILLVEVWNGPIESRGAVGLGQM